MATSFFDSICTRRSPSGPVSFLEVDVNTPGDTTVTARRQEGFNTPCPGAVPGQLVAIQGFDPPDGIALTFAEVAAEDVITIFFANGTGGDIAVPVTAIQVELVNN